MTMEAISFKQWQTANLSKTAITEPLTLSQTYKDWLSENPSGYIYREPATGFKRLLRELARALNTDYTITS